MSKRTQSPSLSQRFAALIRYWLDVPSREEVKPWREDQMHTHRLFALVALAMEAQEGIPRSLPQYLDMRRALKAALDAFGQMEPPR